MEISHILANRLPAGRTQLLSSIIEPDQPLKNNQNQFIIKKVPLAQKIVIQDYLLRANISHLNIPTLNIQNNSKFYLTIYIEKTKPFLTRDLLVMTLQARTNLLIDMLKTISFLSSHFGFFYVTQKMLGYCQTGRIKVWINEDVQQNRRKFPIDHGKLSEEIFVSDFKECFGENFRTLPEFHSAKTIDSLVNLLAKGQSIYQSIHISQPINKNSLIFRNKEITTSYDDHIFSKITNKNQPVREMNSPQHQSLNSVLKRQISISYLPVQTSQVLNQSPRKVMRTISNPTNYRESVTTQSNLNFNKLYSAKKSLFSSSSCINLEQTNKLNQSTTKIQFNYALHKQAWKKKKQDQESKKSRFFQSRNILSRTTSANNLYRSTYQQSSPLKVSFPHTTTHTFTPFASNGDINLHFNENISEKKQVPFVKEEENNQNVMFEPHISEQSNEVEMDLDCLFSDAGNDLQSREQMEILQVLAQEFENILLA